MKPKSNHENEQKLVNFLKQNQPFPRKSNRRQEQQLMRTISSQNISSSLPQNRHSILITSAFFLGFLLIFINLVRNNFSPRIAQEQENMETFMINAWRGSMAEPIENSEFYNPEEEWLLLTENNFLSSEP